MKTQCPNCKARFNTNDASVGKQAKCPKCAKPFTIEPFIETPLAVENSVKIAQPVVPPARSPEPAAPPAKSPEPIAPPVKIAAPAEPPAPAAPPIRSPAPIAPPVKSPAPISPPIKKLTAEHAETTEKTPETTSADSAASAVKSVSKMVFVYCWTGARIVAGILGALGLMLAIKKGAHSTLIEVFAAADVFLVCSVAIEYSLFYKMWAAIRDSQTSITPAKAVGFLFIPVFNIYWALLMVTGFAEDYNAFIQRRAIKTKDLPMAIFLIYAFAFMLSETVLTIPMMCIFAFLGLIYRAFDGYPAAFWALLAFLSVSGIAHFITYILFAFKTCNAVNALPGRNSR
jgi:predicted Zn finger-like uncharacterized protein